MSEITELVTALAQAHLEFDPVLRESTNPAFRGSKYADMASVIRATQPALAKNGLVIIQFPISAVAEQQAGIRTILAHKSGQFIESEYMLPAVGRNQFDAQSCGSTFTYARRYAYMAVCGVAPEDDDGNAATGRGTKEAATEVAAEKLRTHAAGNETVVVKHAGIAGYLALSGPGLPIVMATLDSKAKGKIGMMTKGVTWMIPTNHLGEFVKYCTTEKVAVDESSLFGQDAPKTDSPLTKANIPPAPVLPESGSKSTDPILMEVTEVLRENNPKIKKDFLSARWNGKEYKCWDKGLWPALHAAVKHPVMLHLVQNGAWENIDGLIRVDGMQLGDASETDGADGFDTEY